MDRRGVFFSNLLSLVPYNDLDMYMSILKETARNAPNL